MNTTKPMPPEFKDPELKQLADYFQAEFQAIHSRLDQMEADARARYLDLRKRFEKLDERFEYVQSEVADFKARVRKVERKVLTEDELFS